MKKLRYLAATALAVAGTVAAALLGSGCGYCQHKLKELEKTPSTCQEQGVRTAYECEKCGMTFGYSDEKGLYEITEREPAPLSKHTLSDEFSGTVEDGKFTVSNKCAVCGEEVEIENERLFPFAPSDNAHGKHVRIGNVAATEFTFGAGSAANTKYVIVPTDDSHSDNLVNVAVPFSANASRYLVMFAFNSSDIDLDITYGAECYGKTSYSEKTTIPAGGYTTLPINILLDKTQENCYHELYLNQSVDKEVKITLCGYYYDVATLKSVTLPEDVKTRYEEGEELDKDGITLIASYNTGAKRVVSADELDCVMFGRPLAMTDEEVALTYKGHTVKYNITVMDSRHKLTLVGAKFADGTTSRLLRKGSPLPNDIVRTAGKIFTHWTDTYGNVITDFEMGKTDVTLKAVYFSETVLENFARGKTCTASEEGFNPSGFGLGKLTDGAYSNYNAWGSNAHDSANAEVWVQVDLEEVKKINEVDLFKRSDGSYYPVSYYIEVSEDGENYTKVFSMDYDEKARNKDDIKRLCFFEEVSARYVRITATELTNGGGGAYYLDFAEIEVYYG